MPMDQHIKAGKDDESMDRKSNDVTGLKLKKKMAAKKLRKKLYKK